MCVCGGGGASDASDIGLLVGGHWVPCRSPFSSEENPPPASECVRVDQRASGSACLREVQRASELDTVASDAQFRHFVMEYSDDSDDFEQTRGTYVHSAAKSCKLCTLLNAGLVCFANTDTSKLLQPARFRLLSSAKGRGGGPSLHYFDTPRAPVHTIHQLPS